MNVWLALGGMAATLGIGIVIGWIFYGRRWFGELRSDLEKVNPDLQVVSQPVKSGSELALHADRDHSKSSTASASPEAQMGYREGKMTAVFHELQFAFKALGLQHQSGDRLYYIERRFTQYGKVGEYKESGGGETVCIKAPTFLAGLGRVANLLKLEIPPFNASPFPGGSPRGGPGSEGVII